MIIEYDIHCHERTLQIKFPDGYEHLKEEILEMLDGYYFEWHDATDPFITDTPLEEYMMDRLSETYNIWEWWDTDYYGDNEEEMAVETVPVINPKLPERETLWVCEHCLWAIESREGNQATLRHYVDETDAVDSRCDWCKEVGFDTLYELI